MKVLLITAGIFHPPLWGRILLHSTLRKMEGFTFEHVSSLEKIPANLESFSALVLHYHHKILSPAALARLEAFVRDGGGVLAIHAATASFKQTPAYFAILGGRFTGHAKVAGFSVEKVKDDIFGGIADFSVRDELYLHETAPGIEVHFTAEQAGREVPVVWTYRYGKGRVCYAVPGHTSATMKNPLYQALLRRGLAWVTACEN